MVNTWTLITTHNRHDMLGDLLTDVDRDRTVIVDHRSDPPVVQRCAGVIRCDCAPNISHLWNLGLNRIDTLNRESEGGDVPFNVLVCNDDLRIPAGTIPALAAALRAEDATVAYPDVHALLRPGRTETHNVPGPYNLFTRMTGFCFMLRGERGIRADERLVWWYGDDDIEWRAALTGGAVRVGGVTVQHLSPNGSLTDPELVAQTARDRETFIEKWNRAPW